MPNDKPPFIYIVCHHIKDAYAYAADRKLSSSAWLWVDATVGYRIQLATATRPIVVLFHTDIHSTHLKQYLRTKKARIRYLAAPTRLRAAAITQDVVVPVKQRRVVKG